MTCTHLRQPTRYENSTIEQELEELSFKVLYPKIYNEIVVLMTPAGQRDVYLKQLAEINEDINGRNMEAGHTDARRITSPSTRR